MQHQEPFPNCTFSIQILETTEVFLLTSSGRCLLRYPRSKASSWNGFFSTGLSWKNDPILALEKSKWPTASQTCSSSDLLPDSATWADLMWTSCWETPDNTRQQLPGRQRLSNAEHTLMAYRIQPWLEKAPFGNTLLQNEDCKKVNYFTASYFIGLVMYY